MRNALNGNLSDEVENARTFARAVWARRMLPLPGLIAVAREIGSPSRDLEMRRLSFFGMACIVIVIAAAQVLPFLDLADPELASADSVIAGIVATAVLIGERFPI